MRQLEDIKRSLDRPAEEVAEELGVSVKDVRLENFAAHLTGGTSTEEAGRLVGISPATAYRWANNDWVKAQVKEWRSQVRESLVRKLIRYGNRSIEVLGEILEDGEVSAQTRSNVAFGILDRLGLSPQQLAQLETEGTRVVIEQFLQLNIGDAAAAQQQRALGLPAPQGEAVEGEYTVV